MLAKSMKYEFRASGRLLLPLFGLGLAMSVVLRFLLWLAGRLSPLAGQVVSGIAGSIGVLLLVAVVLVTFVAVVVRFYQSTVASEAYLTFTLPVKTSTHIWAKLLVGTCYSMLSLGVAILCGYIFIPGFGDTVSAASIGEVVVDGVTYSVNYTMPFSTKALIIGSLVVFAIITIASLLLQVYASFAIGSQLGRNRVLFGVLAFFVLNTVESIITLPMIIFPMFAVMGRTEAQIEAFMMKLVNPVLLVNDPQQFVNNILGFAFTIAAVSLLITLIFAVVHYFITLHYMGKKLNLE